MHLLDMKEALMEEVGNVISGLQKSNYDQYSQKQNSNILDSFGAIWITVLTLKKHNLCL